MTIYRLFKPHATIRETYDIQIHIILQGSHSPNSPPPFLLLRTSPVLEAEFMCSVPTKPSWLTPAIGKYSLIQIPYCCCCCCNLAWRHNLYKYYKFTVENFKKWNIKKMNSYLYPPKITSSQKNILLCPLPDFSCIHMHHTSHISSIT